MEKHIEYFLNGKEVSKSVITKRKNKKLDEVVLTEQRYYDAPLTKKEKADKDADFLRASKAFASLREQREDLEARHG